MQHGRYHLDLRIHLEHHPDRLTAFGVFNASTRNGQDLTSYLAAPLSPALGASLTAGVHRHLAVHRLRRRYRRLLRELIAETVAVANLPLMRIERHLAPELTALNTAGAWNGHVPVTAINMAILACAALLYGYRWVVFSNERSADEPTLESAAGEPVNHQYSKSLAFETGFRTAIHTHVAGDLEVFSLLRPLGEAAVTRDG